MSQGRQPQNSTQCQIFTKQNIFKVRKMFPQISRDKSSRGLYIQKENDIRIDNKSQINRIGAQYQFQIAIISSSQYQQLNKKYTAAKNQIKSKTIKRFIQLSQKNRQLKQYQQHHHRLSLEQHQLLQKRNQLKHKLQRLRLSKNQHIDDQNQSQSNNIYHNVMTLQYCRDMLMSLQYQNGLNINPDQMTYEQLLQLGEKIGNVNIGFTSNELNLLTKKIYHASSQEQKCMICFSQVTQGQNITQLPCKHIYHCECIGQWLTKQKFCPMCKKQICINNEKNSVQIKEKQQQNKFQVE